MSRLGANVGTMSYHHGDLRQALIDAATELLSSKGVADLSLREVARRAGVSHAAPGHHFGDKLGLLTAVAADGFRLLGHAVRAARDAHRDDPRAAFAAGGEAYVSFAQRHPGHFAVMFRGDLHRMDDEDLTLAAGDAYNELVQMCKAITGDDELSDAAWIAWAFVHGVATLGIEGQWRLIAGSAEPTSIYRRLAPRVLAAVAPDQRVASDRAGGAP